MEMKIQDALSVHGALQRLGKLPFSGLVSYRIAKLTKLLRPTAEAFEEAQAKLLKEVGNEDAERPGTYAIKDRERWVREMKQLGEEMVTLDTPIRFKLADFGDAKIEPEIFTALDPFIDGEG